MNKKYVCWTKITFIVSMYKATCNKKGVYISKTHYYYDDQKKYIILEHIVIIL